jgi:F-type H+-transporting ATPase subunit delta
MRKPALAKRYATALVSIGKEDGNIEKYGKELSTIARSFKENPALYKTLLNPMYPLKERTALAEEIFAWAGNPVKRLLSLLIERRDIRLVEAVAERYTRMEDELVGRIRVAVYAAAPLEPAQFEEIKGKIESSTGKRALVSFEKRPELLGGLFVRIGNRVIDGSVKTQLERAREKLLEGVIS